MEEAEGDATMSAKEINEALYGRKSRDKLGVRTDAKGREDRTYMNIVFHSKHEMEVYRDYVLPNEHIGIFRDVRRQVKYDLHAVTPGGFKVKIATWKADFVALDREGKTVVMDAKGYPTEIYRRSKKHFEAEYGLRILEL